MILKASDLFVVNGNDEIEINIELNQIKTGVILLNVRKIIYKCETCFYCVNCCKICKKLFYSQYKNTILKIIIMQNRKIFYAFYITTNIEFKMLELPFGFFEIFIVEKGITKKILQICVQEKVKHITIKA